MAGALKPFADDLEDQLTCPICQEIFTDPKTLPCLHNFCSKCIVDWYERSGNPATKRFDCPICRVRIDVPDGDASKFRSSFHLKSLSQLLEAARAKSDQEQEGLPVCMSCEEHSKMVAFCLQCNGLICNECLHSHQRLKKIRQEHQVQLVTDFKKENVESFVKSQMFCQVKFHERNKLEYYCKEETCKKCVCQKCASLKHRNHDLLSIEEAAELTKQAAKLKMEKLNQLKENNYKEELNQSKMNMTRIENDIDLSKQKVRDVVESIIKAARDHGTAMTNKLDGILSEQRKASKDEQRDIEAGIQELDEFLLRCETLLDKSAASEIAVSKDDLQQRCQSYLERPLILPNKPIQRNVIVRYVANQEVTQSLQNVGRVLERVADPLHSSIESMKEVRCGFVNDFVIITRDSEDEVCHTDKGSIDLRIKDPEGNEAERRLTEESTGKYRVRYRAEKTVQYEVEVNIGGQPIRNSPQKVNTLDRNTEFVHLKKFSMRMKDGKEEEKGGEKSFKEYYKKISFHDVNQEIAVLNPTNQCIKIFDVDGNSLRSLKVVSPEMEESKNVFLTAFVLDENKIIVSIFNKGYGILFKELDFSGTLLNTIQTSVQPCAPFSLCLTEDQNLAVSCVGTSDGRIKPGVKVFSKQGELIREFDGFKEGDDPYFITYIDDKHFVSLTTKHCIRVFDKNGAFLYQFGEEGELGGQFHGVVGLTGYGRDRILVCDHDNHGVQLLTTRGEFITSLSRYDGGVMKQPLDVAVGADGKVFVLQFDGKVHIWR